MNGLSFDDAKRFFVEKHKCMSIFSDIGFTDHENRGFFRNATSRNILQYNTC